MPDGYRTYIFGEEAQILFDRELLANLKDDMFWWRLSWVYRSNWRVLHIDGFETGPKIPAYLGYTRIFFNYEITAPQKENG